NSLANEFNLKLDDDTITIKISGAYDVDISGRDWKYVYSQQIREGNDEENTVYITNKRYTFEKQGKSWRIIRVDYYMSVYSDRLLEERGLSKNELIGRMRYGKYNNKEVEYILSFTLKDED
ncbi:hypothetical protein TR13x_03210, partial [Caloranaerobacter sp. TR13]|uniref:hypothetical protein n=1 Tax=Caloranaerobacter sp. TR13 TaxID=1302151 RepID=UPI0006D43A0C